MKILDAKWSQIKKIQNIPVVRSMYIWIFIVPVLVKSLSEVHDKLNMHIYGQDITIYTNLPFSFWLFYFSALCFVMANVIYRLKCPQLVQDHDSWRNFAEHGMNKDHLTEYVKQFKSKIPEHKYREIEALKFSSALGGALQDQFWKFHDIAELQSRPLRKTANILNILAFIFMGIVVLQNLIAVIIYAFKLAHTA